MFLKGKGEGENASSRGIVGEQGKRRHWWKKVDIGEGTL